MSVRAGRGQHPPPLRFFKCQYSGKNNNGGGGGAKAPDFQVNKSSKGWQGRKVLGKGPQPPPPEKKKIVQQCLNNFIIILTVTASCVLLSSSYRKLVAESGCWKQMKRSVSEMKRSVSEIYILESQEVWLLQNLLFHSFIHMMIYISISNPYYGWLTKLNFLYQQYFLLG